MPKAQMGKIVRRDDNSIPTTIPQFDGIDVTELYSIRNQALEESYNPTFNDAQKRSMKWIVKFLEDKIIEVSGKTWLSTGNLPSELTNIVFNPVAKRNTNKPQCDFKIEDWSDLVIKINVYDTSFHEIDSSTSCMFTLKQLGWTGLKLEILKDLSVGVYKLRNQQVNNAISQLNKQISYMVGMDIHPIETEGRGKSQYRVSNVDIELYDADEKLIDAQKKSDPIYFSKDYDDGYQKDALQRHLSIDADDIY